MRLEIKDVDPLAISAADTQLVLSDGTQVGTNPMLESLAAESDDAPWQLTAVGDLLFFTPFTEQHGRELWRTDGTAAGTRLVRDIAPGPEDSDPHGLREVDGKLLFAASTPEGGSELWTSDGTTEGTHLLAELATGRRSSDPAEPIAIGDRVLFSALRDDVGRELFALDRRLLEPECTPLEGAVCLGAGRFRVTVDWLDRATGRTGRAGGEPLTDDSAVFWFFNAENVELVVKVLDARVLNGNFWVYFGALSDIS
jgi:ELWxxDGT repeat protein